MDKEETREKMSQSLGCSFEACELARILLILRACYYSFLSHFAEQPNLMLFPSETFLNPDLIDFLVTPDLN